MRRRALGLALLSAFLVVGCPGDDDETPTEPDPATGDLEVGATTSGEDLDQDGYDVLVDGSREASIGINGSTTVTDLSAGDHDVELSDVADNCSVQGGASQTVTVPDGSTASLTFSVECEPLTGSLEVSASTSGDDPDADGYRVTLDGSSSDSIGPDGSTTFTEVSTGDHDVELSDVAENCSVQGDNPRTVTVAADSTSSTSFSVECQSATGDLQVTSSTSGQEQDTDGYTVSVDGSQAGSLGPDDTTTVADLSTGDHDVELGDVKSNCSVQGDNPRTVSVAFDSTSTASFSVDCQATAGDLEVSVATTGDTTDPDGYEVTVDGSSSQSVAPDGTVTFTGLSEGDHDVELSGIQANCAPGGPNPRTASVTAGQTTSVSYSVDCEPALYDRIVFQSDRTGDPELYAMNPDGSSPTRLTTDGGSGPDVSPDGTRIVFTSARDGDREIYVMRLDGSTPTQVTNNQAAFDHRPTWSPDGSKIAFESDRGGDEEIYTVDPDGGNLQQVTTDAGDDQEPDWTADGSKLVFHSDRDGDADIYRINPDGTALEQLTTNTGIRDWSPAVAPDGSKIAFESERSGNFEIYTMNPGGTGVARLTDDPASDFNAAWSPDLQRLTFTATRDGNFEIYRIDRDGSGLINLTANSATDAASTWAPSR